MSLFTRLIGLEDNSISAHTFYCLAAEVQRDKITGQQAGNLLGLNAQERTEAGAIIARVTGGFVNPEELHQVLMVASSRIGLYDTEATLKSRLGIA